MSHIFGNSKPSLVLSLDNITDVNTTSPTNGQALVWSSGASEWINATVSTGGGVVDHGLLDGLLDNDHPQYRLTATTINFSEIGSTGHNHTVANITDFTPNDYSLSGHIHSYSEITSTAHTHADYSSSAHTHTDYTLSGDFNTHTGTSNIHFLESAIDIDNIVSAHTHNYVESGTSVEFANLSATTIYSGVVELSTLFGSGGVSKLTGLTDVVITTPTNLQALVYSAASGEWVNGSIAAGGVTDHGLLDAPSLLDDDHPQYTLTGITSTHTGTSNIHFTEASINIDNIVSAHSHSDLTLTADTASHTGTTNIHFLESAIDIDNIVSAHTHNDYSSSAHTHAYSEITSTAHTHVDYTLSGDFNTHTGTSTIHFTEGSIDHGSIAGLTADDHTQYFNDARLTGTVHSVLSATTIYSGANNLTSVFAPSSHTHPIGEVTGFDPADYSLSGHSHANYALDSSLTTLSGTVTAHTADSTIHFTVGSLGLGQYSQTGHTHAYSEITSTAHTHSYSSGTHDSKSLTLRATTDSEDVTLMVVTKSIDTMSAHTLVVGTSPSVTWSLKYGTDRTAAGTELTGGTTTSTTSEVATAIGTSLSAGDIVWLETSATGGTVSELHMTLSYSGSV